MWETGKKELSPFWLGVPSNPSHCMSLCWFVEMCAYRPLLPDMKKSEIQKITDNSTDLAGAFSITASLHCTWFLSHVTTSPSQEDSLKYHQKNHQQYIRWKSCDVPLRAPNSRSTHTFSPTQGIRHINTWLVGLTPDPPQLRWTQCRPLKLQGRRSEAREQ